ncbi:hypothetical protein FUAX_52080 (plasmid) [Fulvitalea axinellae]|uniref:Thiol-disulfide oxidoreductase DCC family protein n=1 Tax=Fulvitalea axinellae TaxID=1182444 RepID=A0AAU9DI37_9BACT|nr:hypothetical protein FUAX_52080 [Fulvitalea axinellae]
MTTSNPTVLFDGVCNLCDKTVRFVIRHDRKAKIKFASLQSATGQKLLERHGLPVQDFETFVFIEDGRAYTKSTAALKVLSTLGGGWKVLAAFRFVPEKIRDFAYLWIAKRRYKLFGKKEVCELPLPSVRERFLG